MLGTGWDIGQIRVHDLMADRAEAFCARLRERDCPAEPRPARGWRTRFCGAAIVLFATTSPKPYPSDPTLFTPEQTILHVSLRDLDVPVILSACRTSWTMWSIA